MRRVLLVMPLLVALVACGGSSTLTAEDVTLKLADARTCRAEPVIEERPVGKLWRCDPLPGDVAPGRFYISVYNSRQDFLDGEKQRCDDTNYTEFGPIIFGQNWRYFAPSGNYQFDVAEIQTTLNGERVESFDDVCKKFGF
jgi:hypothetical protein